MKIVAKPEMPQYSVNIICSHHHPDRKEAEGMTIKEAVVARVTALLAERSMRPIELAKRAGLTPSTVYSFLDPNRREATINVIQKICEGLGVSVAEFFDDEMFK